jgi:hypothetical protein
LIRNVLDILDIIEQYEQPEPASTITYEPEFQKEFQPELIENRESGNGS